MNFLDNFSKLKVLIVGDVMLDRFWWGSVKRISPEAPVPIVDLKKTSLVVGGAANVAANVAGLGAEAILVGVIGEDEEARIFPDVLKSSNVSADYLVSLKDRPTSVKTRIIAHSQQVVRIDREIKASLSAQEETQVWEKINRILSKIDVIIISDYAKGVLTDDLLSRLITKANYLNKKILVDPKGKRYLKYKNATILTPNKREAAEACNLEDESDSVLEKAGKKLLEELNLEGLLITRGGEGMSIIQKNFETTKLKALARKIFDVTGAGDTVIATLAVSLGAGADFIDSAKIANIAAGLVVEQIGTTAITIDELKQAL